MGIKGDERRCGRIRISGFVSAFLALLCVVLSFCAPRDLRAFGLSEAVSVSESGVYLSDGYGGPLPSSFQLAQLGAALNSGFNQQSQILALLLQELTKKSLDSEALLRGIGEYFTGLEAALKELQRIALTQKAAYSNNVEEVFGHTPFACSDKLTATAMKNAKRSMRLASNALRSEHIRNGEGTQKTEVGAEEAVARRLLSVMAGEMTGGTPDAEHVPSSISMFPFSGVMTGEGQKIFQAVIAAANSEPMPTITNTRSFSGKRALELQGIKMGRLAGIQEGMQIAFDLQQAVINGAPFSEMQLEVNRDVGGEQLNREDYIEGASSDQSGAISLLQAFTHQFERARIANPDWYAKIEHGGMTEQGLLRELIKLSAW
ncbi:MAG: hypothetical protein K5657_05580, partial [Desulfovibrio sp.]|nr:hypothetical protein [Desulfovibrio sp.]